AAGIQDIIGVDKSGILSLSQDYSSHPNWATYAQKTNPRQIHGGLSDALCGADVFIGVSAAGLLSEEDLRKMAPQAIVLAMANPVPEIDPLIARRYAAIVGTGRSDYPNQINNVLGFPGFFRGLLDVRARHVTVGMKLAAAQALAEVLSPEELTTERILPSAFDPRVVPKIAAAVAAAARIDGVARL
ncbi:MAG: NAD-dependent malic enzyme, partial [Firmicutes bacterium]|nr:NAD-dependent malic enzyme [Bacillota bacterium]